MKYTISRSDYFGIDYDVYDSETLTKTNHRGSSIGEFMCEYATQMTEEEMKAFAHEKYVSLLEEMRREILKIQEKYDEKIKVIQEFEKAIDKRSQV
jgi:hypothetical protein